MPAGETILPVRDLNQFVEFWKPSNTSQTQRSPAIAGGAVWSLLDYFDEAQFLGCAGGIVGAGAAGGGAAAGVAGIAAAGAGFGAAMGAGAAAGADIGIAIGAAAAAGAGVGAGAGAGFGAGFMTCAATTCPRISPLGCAAV